MLTVHEKLPMRLVFQAGNMPDEASLFLPLRAFAAYSNGDTLNINRLDLEADGINLQEEENRRSAWQEYRALLDGHQARNP